MSERDCEHAGYSHKKGRVYCRKFSYAEARERHAAGETVTALAADYGVSPHTVRRVVDPEFRKRFDSRSAEWLHGGRCPDCGIATTRHKAGEDRRCRDCASAVLRTSVALNDVGEIVSIRCGTCKKWKMAEEFSPSRRRLARRRGGGGGRTCRVCETALRKAYRDRVKVPCSRCGKPCLPASERLPGNRAKGLNVTDLCRSCWQEVEAPKIHAKLRKSA